MDFATVYMHALTGKSLHTAAELKIASDMYDARIRKLDDRFADLMRRLASEMDLDQTIVVLVADHGENIGDHDLLGHNFCIYNTLIHVPLVVRWPELLRPQRVYRLVQTHDLYPTILGWLGAEVAQSTTVMVPSLAAALTSSPESDRRRAYAEYPHPCFLATREVKEREPLFDPSPWMVGHQAIFDQRWYLIVRTDRRTELYDLATDPGETNNLAMAQPGEVARLKRLLADWRRSFKPFVPNPSAVPPGQRLDAGQLRRLRDLGYVQWWSWETPS